MNCHELSSQVLSEYVDRDVPAELLVCIEEHLRICPHCQARARQMRVTIVLTQRLEVRGAEHEMVVRIRRRILRIDRG